MEVHIPKPNGQGLSGHTHVGIEGVDPTAPVMGVPGEVATCEKCGETKLVSAFYRDRRSKRREGFFTSCRVCCAWKQKVNTLTTQLGQAEQALADYRKQMHEIEWEVMNLRALDRRIDRLDNPPVLPTLLDIKAYDTEPLPIVFDGDGMPPSPEFLWDSLTSIVVPPKKWKRKSRAK